MKLSDTVKRPIRAVLSAAGLEVHKTQREPFQELLEVTRFTPRTVELLGRPFQIGDGPSFFYSYREIFLEEIYRFDTHSATPRIVDCGSNYGTSLVYFKNLYAGARITGVEADPAIFRLLAQNCADLDVELINKAVSDSHEAVEFYCQSGDSGRAARALHDPKTGIRVPGVTLDELIDGPVDFLKIDIEGSEVRALEVCTRIGQVQQMFVEYHSFQGEKQTLDRLLRLLSANGFRYFIRDQMCSTRPLVEEKVYFGMDLQLNIFAKRESPGA
jgi:FkbM family methyltransferase